MQFTVKEMSTDGRVCGESDTMLRLADIGRIDGVEYRVVHVDVEPSKPYAFNVEMIPHRCRECSAMLGQRVFRHEARSYCPVCAVHKLSTVDWEAQRAEHDARRLPHGNPVTDTLLDEPRFEPTRTCQEMNAEIAHPPEWIPRETARELSERIARSF